ncbi:MAG: heavy metal sensor histidine kinase [Acidobacteriaceae bacterium]
MRPLPIRLRLTLWYFAVLAVGLLAFAFFTLAMLEHAMHRTVDDRLRAHMTAVQQIIREDENTQPAALQHDLDEDVELAPDLTLLEIWDASGHVVYRSAAMNRMQVTDRVPTRFDRSEIRAYHRHRLRTLVRSVTTPHAKYIVMVAIPVHDFVEASHRLESVLWIAIPLLLILAGAGGYWIAGRALSPILSMIAAAQAIHPSDLSTRLQVPSAKDELQRLSLTLNGMLDRLQAGFERITRFTADASHELRTPIALLRTRTEILLRRPRSAEEYRTALEANLDELERTSALLEELMLLARADAGAETLSFSDVDLTELVRSTASLTQPLADAKELTWSVALPPAPVHTHGDASALRRLLVVLIDNAVKYTPRHGSVRIALEASGDAATLAVSDTGIGIAEDALPNIFDRFYRADQARERAVGSAGLGLSIGQWIAERHGAAISAQSVLAEGSTFTLKLPTMRK